MPLPCVEMYIKVSIVLWILLSGLICRLGYFPFQPEIHWFIKGCNMCCPVCGKVQPLLLNEESGLYGEGGLPQKKYIQLTICLMSNSQAYANQCALEASLNKTSFSLINRY